MKRHFLVGIVAACLAAIPFARGDAQIFGPVTPDSTLLKTSGAAATHTGDTTETNLGYINIPGGALGANGCVLVDSIWGTTGSAGTWVLYVTVATGTSTGSTSGTDIVSGTVTAGTNNRSSVLICNANSASSQVAFANAGASFTATTNGLGTAAINTASAWTISLNAKVNNSADTIALKHYHAIVYSLGS